MLRNTFTKTLWDNRRVMPLWAAIVGLLALMYASVYPQIAGQQLANLPDTLQGFNLAETSTPANYLQGAVFGLLVPLLIVFYGAATGARMISGDEESGYLDLLLAHPLSRTQLLLQRFAALAAGAVVIGFVVLLAMLAIQGPAELGSIGFAEFAAQSVNVALLGVLFGSLAIAIGAALALTRPVVFGVTAAVGVLAYVLNGLAPQIGAEWMRYVTPFHYYIGGEPLNNGFQAGDILVLLVVSAILIGLGTVRFRTRDIAT